MLGGLNRVALGSATIPANKVVCLCRSVLLSKNFFYGVGVLLNFGSRLFRSVDDRIPLESDEPSKFDLAFLAPLANILLDTVF